MPPVQRAACRVLLLALLGTHPAWAQEVRIHLLAHGALNAEATAVQAEDSAHFCSAAADPWTARDAPDARPTPYPFYRLVFGQAQSGADLAMPGPSIGLTLSNYFAAAHEHSDAVNDSIELVLDGRHFVGHAELRDPAYRFVVTYLADRQGGSFIAHGLHETGAGQSAVTLDVEGSWACPPVIAEAPERAVAVHVLFPGAVRVHAEPAPLRLSRTDIPCVDRGCAGWRVTDEATGFAYLARVDFTRLRLARRLRQEARDGVVDLLVNGEVHGGNPPLVVPTLLDGVAPAVPADVEAALP